MKAITIHQPYASFVIAGTKHYETRSRNTRIRGKVAIHAGAKEPYQVLKNLPPDMRKKVIDLQRELDLLEPPLGAIIGTVEIVDCVQVEALWDQLTSEEISIGDYSAGRFAYVLQNPVMFVDPIPARGAQGWWTWEGSEQ